MSTPIKDIPLPPARVWFDEFGTYTEEEWRALRPGSVVRGLSEVWFAGIDYAKPGGDKTVISHWHVKDGKVVVESIEAVDFFKPDEPATPPATPAKTLHHNHGFFPNKVGRIDVLPRYPGVWG